MKHWRFGSFLVIMAVFTTIISCSKDASGPSNQEASWVSIETFVCPDDFDPNSSPSSECPLRLKNDSLDLNVYYVQKHSLKGNAAYLYGLLSWQNDSLSGCPNPEGDRCRLGGLFQLNGNALEVYFQILVASDHTLNWKLLDKSGENLLADTSFVYHVK